MKRLLPIVSVLLLILFPSVGFAEETKESQGITENEKRAGFTVQAVLPENQVNDRVSFYHLLMQPEQAQTVQVKIFNTSEKKQTYRVEVINAATNRNGLITYDERDKKPDASMKLPITKVAKPKNKEVSVDAYSEGKAEVIIQTPAEAFQGILLGGIRISLKSDDSEEESQGMSVKNTYGYAIGLVLTEQDHAPVYGETDLKLTKVQPEVDYGSKVLEASIQNPYPEAMEDLVAEGKIVRKGQKKALAKNKLESVKIAPNSIFPFQIDWGMLEVSAGEYTFIGTVKGKTKSWSFKQDFTITRQLAKKMNEQTAFRIFIPSWWTTSFYAVGTITAIVTAWLIIRLVKRKKGREIREKE
ncbi:DUF916 and DUF3324 domain-containing protein [Candidatus Enterococcus murrayae]|uniref:DUF916 and DUF3324 domain-containing protein n=1 Tax=Candidatus Enterococcus murrayae TaxID=2815321 RepID=A0ABS3HL62_9ENTE|nr:DUF916 and DUF3324 domain-containing protein [Enterococcus sp. MJM16]MBO0453689.1 DUF916 and DUF3324 domain-containing protein [Enterococcus sp. MJM16]